MGKKSRKPSLLRGARPERVAIYARVSSHKQRARGDLTRQIEGLKRVIKRDALKLTKVYTDVGSGLNTNRKGLWRLLNDAKKHQFWAVVLSFKDRLTRFGYTYLERYLAEFGVSLCCVHTLDEKAPESELVEDLVAIVHSFSGKLYRMRRTEKEREEKGGKTGLIDQKANARLERVRRRNVGKTGSVDQKANARWERVRLQVLAQRRLFARQGAVVAGWRTYRNRRLGPYFRLTYQDRLPAPARQSLGNRAKWAVSRKQRSVRPRDISGAARAKSSF